MTRRGPKGPHGAARHRRPALRAALTCKTVAMRPASLLARLFAPATVRPEPRALAVEGENVVIHRRHSARLLRAAVAVVVVFPLAHPGAVGAADDITPP